VGELLSVRVLGGGIPFASIVGGWSIRGVKTLATPEKSVPAYGLPSTDFFRQHLDSPGRAADREVTGRAGDLLGEHGVAQ
jgi:hypothetical protein